MFGNPLLKDGDTVIMDNYRYYNFYGLSTITASEYPKISSNFEAISRSNSEKSWQFTNMLVGKCNKCFCNE